VYLTGPYVAAASAVAGFITNPEQLGNLVTA
jgi:homoaconitase/3-isopropylmalate dehydratase large subunit